jgi:GT2 family glycosyltransferase
MDKPLLGIPIVRPWEPVRELVESIGNDARVLIVDNSQGGIDWEQMGLPDDAWVTQPYSRLGCGESWNFIMRQALITDPYVLVANADTRLAPGAIEYVVSEMERGGPRWVGIDGDWRLFGITDEWVERVGWFDPNIHPIYMEDCDMEYRGRLAGAEWYNDHRTGSTHGDGLSWKGSNQDERAGSLTDRANQNARTHEGNRRYYQIKWGGRYRGSERYATPFESGKADLCGPTLSILRSQSHTI